MRCEQRGVGGQVHGTEDQIQDDPAARQFQVRPCQVARGACADAPDLDAANELMHIRTAAGTCPMPRSQSVHLVVAVHGFIGREAEGTRSAKRQRACNADGAALQAATSMQREGDGPGDHDAKVQAGRLHRLTSWLA